jgi:hypothetical protein
MNTTNPSRPTLDDVVKTTLASVGPLEVPPTLAARAASAAFAGRLSHVDEPGFLATWASLWLRGAVASAALAAASVGVLLAQPPSASSDAVTTSTDHTHTRGTDAVGLESLATTPDLDTLFGAVVAPSTTSVTISAGSHGSTP